MVSFVQFLANFGTKTYKNCTKNGIFLLYLWINVVLLRICVAILCIKRINVALIYNKWYAYLHKLPPLLYTICVILHTIYDFIMVSYDFIMCEIRDFALFLVKICRIIQKYPPLCRKDFYEKTFPCFVYNIQKYL